MPYRIDIDYPDADALEHLILLGALDIDQAGSRIAALMPDRVAPDEITRALRLTVAPAVTPAIGRDDDSVWMLRPRPIRVGRFTLVPSDFDAGGGLRLLDRPAFGTGVHPTTALCLEAIEAETDVAMPERMLDVGTGSGVLALAAVHCGVARVTAVDIDAGAVTTTRENARLNQMDDRLDVLEGGPDVVSGTWPLVVANILAAPLIEMAPTLVQRIARGGFLILSGIPDGVAAEVERCYSRLGMRRTWISSRGGWVALTLRATW